MEKNIKRMSFAALAALAMVSCSNHDEWMTYEEFQAAKYDAAFVQKYGNIDPNHTWGFSSVGTRAVTRSVFTETWDGVHANCKFDDSVFDMDVPSGAVDLTKGNFTDAEKKAAAFYIKGNGDFNAPFNFPAGCKIYISGTVTSLSANYDGKVTFYNTGTFTFTGATAARHTVINTGTLTVTDYANIGDVYNKGTLVLERGHNQWWPNEGGTADIPNDMHIYSNGEGSVMMPDGGDLKAVCDIHGTLTVGNRDQGIVKNVKIQNGTRKYICGIDATGTVENVDGALETSYIKADLFTFDGNPIYLLPGGHVDVTTLKVINSGCHFYGATGSNGLIEAVNYEFGNKNDFTHTFSNNIYFKVKGGTIKVDNCYAHGQSEGTYATVEAYLANTADEFDLAKDRINAGNATGSPACGEPWTVGKTNEDVIIDQGRVFCEDLGSIGDFDFNDVVFDAYIYKSGKVEITLLAAGGILPITVAGEDVHALLGEGMVNTGAGPTHDPVTITTSGYETINDIPVVVSQTDNAGKNMDILLKTEIGKAPQKICVPVGTKWLKEYKDISDGYSSFKSWVSNSSVKAFEQGVVEHLYIAE
ncbi:MAG: hypothetical protein J1E57_07190 [Prevotella sp.]|nr:hypothetical protein [Prevotella sp.]